MGIDGKQIVSRRDALKITGTSMTAGLVGVTGCMGEGGSGDGSSGDGGSGGGDGSSDGGSTGGGSNTDLTMAMAPGGMSGLVMNHIAEDTSILADEMDAEGYNMEVQYTYDDVNLLAAGQNQFAAAGPIDAARIANERDIELSLLSKNNHMFPGWITRPGSQFDPEEVGSLEQAVTNIAENGRWGTAFWANATVPASMTVFNHFGYDLAREGGDVNVTVGGFEAIGEAVIQNNLDVASSSPDDGTVTHFVSDPPELTFVLHMINQMKELGFGAPSLNSWSTTPEFLESDRGASRALINAWEQGIDWFFSSPQEIMMNEENWENFGASTEEEADYIYRLFVETSLNLSEPVLIQDFRWTEDLVSKSHSFLEQVQNVGVLQSGWKDKVQYVQDI